MVPRAHEGTGDRDVLLIIRYDKMCIALYICIYVYIR